MFQSQRVNLVIATDPKASVVVDDLTLSCVMDLYEQQLGGRTSNHTA